MMCFCYSLRNLFAPWTWEPAQRCSSTTLRTESTVSGESGLLARMLHEPLTNPVFDCDTARKIKDRQTERQGGRHWLNYIHFFIFSFCFYPLWGHSESAAAYPSCRWVMQGTPGHAWVAGFGPCLNTVIHETRWDGAVSEAPSIHP